MNPTVNKRDSARRLKRHAISALLRGSYAGIGGRTRAARAKNLIKIASAYSLEELLSEPGIGVLTAAEIERWLEDRGNSLRDRPKQQPRHGTTETIL